VTVTTVEYGDIYPVTPEGKIIASVLMVFGIAILGILISTLGASFIESRLNPKITIEEESKKAINEKISKLEFLNKDEYYSLILSINTLYNDLIKRQSENTNTSTFPKCNNSYPKDSRFCNRCRYLL
jgi:voltage-gated potassium channel